jgi:hypothetical protein
MSEATTLFAMVVALYFTVRCAETGRLRFLFLAGVFAGWAGRSSGGPRSFNLHHLFAPSHEARIEAGGEDTHRDSWVRGSTDLMVLV